MGVGCEIATNLKQNNMKEKFRPQAGLPLSNMGGVSIEINDSGEAVRYQWYDKKPSRWCQIKYNIKGDPFFRINNTRFYLDEFERFHSNN